MDIEIFDRAKMRLWIEKTKKAMVLMGEIQ